jgi:Arc/MetJ-type ribon-helix-helix transcriptional regulator
MKRTVVKTDPEQVARVLTHVAEGRYRTVSDFVREAMDEKLARLDEALLTDEVARYCAAGHADEDPDLIASQAFEPPSRVRSPAPRLAKKKVRRAPR